VGPSSWDHVVQEKCLNVKVTAFSSVTSSVTIYRSTCPNITDGKYSTVELWRNKALLFPNSYMNISYRDPNFCTWGTRRSLVVFLTSGCEFGGVFGWEEETFSVDKSFPLSFHPTSGGKQITKLSIQTPEARAKHLSEIWLELFRFMITERVVIIRSLEHRDLKGVI
jgi:hypothetical protein